MSGSGIDTAVVMCGGNNTRFAHVCKSIIMYKGEFIISHVLRALKGTGVKRVVLKANPSNSEIIDTLARKQGLAYTLVDAPPRMMRYALQELEQHLDDVFYFVVGNQPMPASHLEHLAAERAHGAEWVCSLYTRGMQDSVRVRQSTSRRVGLAQEEGLYLQHPLVLTPDIIAYQQAEGFANKLEGTIGALLQQKQVHGIMAPMPPEFDTWEMFAETRAYIDKQLP